MSAIELQPWTEPLARFTPPELAGATNPWLWHQVETFEQLAEHPLVVNTSATGTGKTAAAHTHLLRKPHPRTTVIVAPTNALVDQHADDVDSFVRGWDLPHQVIRADAPSLRHLKQQLPGAAGFSNGRLLFGLMQGRLPGFEPDQPRVVVTNPDIFVRAVAFDYGSHARNLAAQLISAVDYLVIDEVHYYDGVQLAGLFLILGLWASGLASRPERRTLLLTATPDGDLLDALAALRAMGVEPASIDPNDAPRDCAQKVSLAPVRLRLEPLTDAAPAWGPEAIEAVEEGEDGAILLDRLDQISQLYRALRPSLGDRVRRITGPTPQESRATATSAPLVLATPTVDLGYNFAGRGRKTRQALDRVWFRAPTLDRFWQRLGRAGRVLGRPTNTVPSHAVAALPTHVLERLPVFDGPIGRPDFAEALRDAAGGRLDRARLGQATAPASADLLHHAWAGMAEAASDSEWVRPFYERFPAARTVPFETALTRGRGLRELDRIRRGQLEVGPRCRFEWKPWFRDPEERRRLDDLLRCASRSSHPHHRQAVRYVERLAVGAGAVVDAARAFRGLGPVDGDVSAWDERGAYLDHPGWVTLPLRRLVRRHTFELLKPDEARRRGAPSELAVLLGEELDPPRRVALVLEDTDDKDFEPRKGRVYGWDRIRLHLEHNGAFQFLPTSVFEVLQEQFETRGLAVYVPFRPGLTRILTASHRLWPWTIWLGEPGRSSPVDGYVGTGAVRAEALVRAHHEELQCPED